MTSARARRLPLATALLVLAVACGGDDDDGAADAARRTVEGAYGPIEFPADPQRILGDLMTVDYLTALGYDTDEIVGVFDAGCFPPDHCLGDVGGRDDIVDPGFQFEPNIEAVAAAEPDLILVPFDQIDGAPALDELREIAPVLVVPTSETRTSPPQQATMETDEYGLVELSQENLALVDGDLLFVEVREGSTRHEDNPLWPSLQVVQDDAVFPVGNHWEYGGAVAAREVLADIDAALDELASRR